MNEVNDNNATKLLMKKALVELKELRAKVNELEEKPREPIAIVGMSCRFPHGANDPEAYWQLLRDGVDAISEIPADRWPVEDYYDPNPDAPGKMIVREGGFLDQVKGFDPAFFNVSPREAHYLDPQQRLLLEVSWEALEHAGIPPKAAQKIPAGVFVGLMNNDYTHRQMEHMDLSSVEPYMLTGNSISFPAGRLAYTLGLQGPAMVVATACSSSLVTVHLACQALRNGECDLALAGGVNLILAPITNVMLSKLRAISPDGRCKTFDASADGYGRGEGCGMVVLKRLSDAQADGDRILAVVRGTAVNHDGASGGLTVPNGLAQEKLLRQVLANARVEASEIDYIEAHGTGTALGDPIEAYALGTIMGENRNPERPLLLGSVKTNIGHTEAAAGVAGLIKVIQAMQYEQIPPHLHLETLNPNLDWDKLPLQVTTECTPWPRKDKPRLAGINSLGLSGVNAHIILEEPPLMQAKANETDRSHHLLTVTAKTEKALQAQAAQYAQHLETHPQQSWADFCYTANTCRDHFAHRFTVVAQSSQEAVQQLRRFNGGEVAGSDLPKIAFLFTGQGSQYVQMGRSLYETEPVFRAALDRCAAILQPIWDYSLLDVLYLKAEANGHAPSLDDTAVTQPALFAIEYALTQLWLSWGIRPHFVMGHSVGEYVAACVANVFSLEDGLRLIVERGRLMQALPRDGQMAVIFASETAVLEAITPHVGNVSLAAINGPQNVVISGEQTAVTQVAEQFTQQGVRVQPLIVSHAFHSHLMDPILSPFQQTAAKITFNTPMLGFVSNVTGRVEQDVVTTANYWRNHIRQPVRFAAGMAALQAQGCNIFIEIGPKPTLLGMGRTVIQANNVLWLPSLRPKRADWQQMLHSLGQLFTYGVTVNWQAVDQAYSRQRITIPTYPFQRQPYWLDFEGKGNGRKQNSKIMTWLAQGDNAQLVAHLRQCTAFSEAEIDLLPQLLAALTKEHQAQIATGQVIAPVDVVLEPTVTQQTLRQRLLVLDEAEQIAQLTTGMLTQIASILGLPTIEELDANQSLLYWGFDSLMAVELNKWIEMQLAVSYPVVKFIEGVTIADAAAALCVLLVASEAENGINLAQESQPDTQKFLDEALDPMLTGQLFAELDELNEAELDALLASMTDANEEAM